jgi:hypothetical protein
VARPTKHWPMVEASRDEACLAVRLYNEPTEVRSFEGFVVHMHLSWLYLLHAEFSRDGVDYRYWRRDKPHLLERVDGEPKRWELARCVRHRWPDAADPVRANLDFFIALRNKIEHRYARYQRSLSEAARGHSQALLLNYEEELSSQFGTTASLATRLRFPIFVGSFTTEGERSLTRLRERMPAPLRKFLAEYDAQLDPSTANDSRYQLRLRVFQELAPKDPDALAIRYVRLDDLSAEERAAVEQLGRKGNVLIKERVRDVAGANDLGPMQVVAAVQARTEFRFNSDDFQRAWKRLRVRPPTGDPHPERTEEKYCTYYPRTRDYGYKPAYVEKLVRECSSAEGFTKLTGKPARDKITGRPVDSDPTLSIPRPRDASPDPSGPNPVAAS